MTPEPSTLRVRPVTVIGLLFTVTGTVLSALTVNQPGDSGGTADLTRTGVVAAGARVPP